MTDKEIKQVKEICEQEILIAMQRFEQLTGKKIKYVQFGFKQVTGMGKVASVKIFERTN